VAYLGIYTKATTFGLTAGLMKMRITVGRWGVLYQGRFGGINDYGRVQLGNDRQLLRRPVHHAGTAHQKFVSASWLPLEE
jgi:hypothetical protein